MVRMSKNARRAQIVSGMMLALAKWGYERATIQKIAAEVDITPGLVHYHFETKREILLATIEELTSRIMRRYTSALEEQRQASTPDWASVELLAWIEAHVGRARGVDAEAMAAWIAISTEAMLSPEVQEPYQAALEHELTVLSTAIEACSPCPNDPRQVAVSLLAMLQGIYLLWRNLDQLATPGFARVQLERAAKGMLEVTS